MVRDGTPASVASSSIDQPSTTPVDTVTVIAVSIVANDRNVNPPELNAVLEGLRKSSPGLELAAPAEPLGGGFWAEMFVLRIRGHGPELPEAVVLRLAPDADLAIAETTIQRCVAERGYPTPRIIAASAVDAPRRHWAVMQLASGRPLLDGLSGLGALAQLPRLARTLAKTLGDVAAHLHALDVQPTLDALEREGVDRRDVAGIVDYYGMVANAVDDPLLARAVETLRATMPPPSHEAVCHGDLHPFNVLADGDRVTLLDWTAARVADPAYDIAFTSLLLAHPPLDAPAPLQRVIRRVAGLLARQFRRSYDQRAQQPIDPRQLEWHTHLHLCRVATDVAAWRHQGRLDAHAGHPWLAMEPAVRARLAQAFSAQNA
jgi:aminoglycoside phosphotransferase (APT) family kinase protein